MWLARRRHQRQWLTPWKGRALALMVLLLLTGSTRTLRAQSPPPEPSATLEIRAQSAFNAGDWAAALPLFRELKRKYAATNPDRVPAIEEQIRLIERNLATNAPPPTVIETSEELRKRHVKPPPGQVYELTIQELGNFDYDQVEGGNIPPDVKALTGSRVRLKGFMIPMDQADAITSFALVPDLFACCFGQPPQIQHTIVARTPKGKAVSYYPDEIVVEGTLSVEEKIEDGFIVSIFEVEVSSVRPAIR
ncbi:MAG: DUF3299 domain-containing protein [Phycisphaerae bacterium]|nr:DUF3299 domain-containing protein [Phycisphaerae bacterium]MDW8262228.1 DUF3299 domain-containing protein [Phycisphaerales bacterium]